MTTVLVTGTGAIIGYGFLRSLSGSNAIRTVATDMMPHAVGQHFADDFITAPRTSDSDYADWLRAVIADKAIDLVIPCIEQDVLWLADAVLSGAIFDARLALNSPELIKLCSDKIAFDQDLNHKRDPCRIVSSVARDFDELVSALGLPFLLKPKHGYASKGIIHVERREDFESHSQRMGSDLLAQKYVGNDDEEYTVSAFCNSGEVCAAIALRRQLAPDGSTLRAETAAINPFGSTLARLSAAYRAEGPTNFQFRMVDGQPFLLEINPRISSATSLRTAFGYNEALMCVAHYHDGQTISQPPLTSGSAIRYIEDVVIHDGRADL